MQTPIRIIKPFDAHAQTMTMAAELRLPKEMPAEARKAYVDKLIAVLGLTKVGASSVKVSSSQR